ncbi:unnamed protein product [Hymenolepis diminuta]|uniref:COMM domain-containing protein n=1 Tax=Hymenolepis diminuta TaxID=6216 RepID=A0A564Z1B7_HYMDI|nr:unnamed protein product [Hymenolepis diminuta]
MGIQSVDWSYLVFQGIGDITRSGNILIKLLINYDETKNEYLYFDLTYDQFKELRHDLIKANDALKGKG